MVKVVIGGDLRKQAVYNRLNDVSWTILLAFVVSVTYNIIHQGEEIQKIKKELKRMKGE